MPVTIQQQEQQDTITIRLTGSLDASGAMVLLRTINSALKRKKPIGIDLAAVPLADSAGIAALSESVALAEARGIKLQATGAIGQVREALDRAPAPARYVPQKDPHFIERLGDSGLRATHGLVAFLQLLADTAYWGLVAPLKRNFVPPGATTTQAIRIGLDALPIVSLIALLLGLIMAFQAAYQLRQFGANIFVANLVGVSMVRELGPLMSAIIVAGRSGSAIAAELGTMTVGEEIDALKTMGINEIRFLVVPRVYAITFTQPAVTIFANAVGILGGYLIAILYLDLSSSAYIQQTIRALSVNDLLSGLSKSVVFAWLIGLIGCHCGLRITGGAEGVGRATTTSVVASIFAIIVADSIFTTLSTLLG